MKQHVFAFVIAFTVITTSFGMLTKVTFKPYIQVVNSEIVEQRNNGEYLNHITIIGKIAENNDNYRCFQYALEKTTGFTGNIDFYGSKDYDIPLNKFFQQIPYPKTDCLAVYTDENLNVKHFAVAIDSVNFKSKLGENSPECLHTLFQLPEEYEKRAYFLELLAKYKNNKQQLHQDLEKADLKRKLKMYIDQALFFFESYGSDILTGVTIGMAINLFLLNKFNVTDPKYPSLLSFLIF